MVKEVKVKFNGVEYRKPVLNTSDTFEFGWKIAPRITSLLTAIGFKVTDLQGENSKTFADVIEKIFDIEVGHWLIDKLILDLDRPLVINGIAVTSEDEIDEHFGGEFIKLASVAFLLACEMLGERQDLMNKLSGSVKNIVNSFEGVVKEYVDDQLTAFKLYENSKKTSKLKKTQKKQS